MKFILSTEELNERKNDAYMDGYNDACEQKYDEGFKDGYDAAFRTFYNSDSEPFVADAMALGGFRYPSLEGPDREFSIDDIPDNGQYAPDNAELQRAVALLEGPPHYTLP